MVNENNIINMDETSITFTPHHSYKVAKKGAPKVVARKILEESNRVTVLLTISSSRNKLSPLIVFKGSPGYSVENEVSQHRQEEVICMV